MLASRDSGILKTEDLYTSTLPFWTRKTEPNFFGLVVGWTFLGMAGIRISCHKVLVLPMGIPEKKGEMGVSMYLLSF